jgi:flagellar hook assembly protein FlgD
VIEPDPGELVKSFTLFQNYPNPFNPSTVISWQLAVGSEVELNIFNLLGQEVRTLVDKRQEAGYHSVRWDGNDNQGNPVASGIYLYRIKTGEFVSVRQMLMMK